MDAQEYAEGEYAKYVSNCKLAAVSPMDFNEWYYLSKGVATAFNSVIKNDPVNHPKHYTNHPSGIECIQITRHMNFNIGSAIKYLWRANQKGNVIEDLQKAIWYINDEIKKLEGEASVARKLPRLGSVP